MRRSPAVPLLLALLGVLLSGCAAPAAGAGTTADGRINIVASTNVYSDIAARIGGDRVNVTALVSRPSQDPHSYEASAQDKLTVSKAALGIENGGGYDDFFDRLADGVLPADKILNVVDISGLRRAGSENSFNEHVWYDVATIRKFAGVLANRLAEVDPGSAPAFRANEAAFVTALSPVENELASVKTAHAGTPFALTEPVPLYLLSAAGLVNVTPPQYSHAIEEGTDVPAGVLKDTTDIVSSGRAKLLAYNSQTEGPQTEVVRLAAEKAEVPVVDFTETLPEGQDYAQWMAANVGAIRTALGSR